MTERVAQLFDDPLLLMASAWADVPADRYGDITHRAAELAALLRQCERGLVDAIVAKVRVLENRIDIDCKVPGIADALSITTVADAPPALTLAHDVRLTRSGAAMRLVHDSGARAAATPDRALVRLLVQAHGWWAELRKGEMDMKSLAAREGLTSSYITRIVRLAFLAPDITQAILTGRQDGRVTPRSLTLEAVIPMAWSEQQAKLLPGAR